MRESLPIRACAKWHTINIPSIALARIDTPSRFRSRNPIRALAREFRRSEAKAFNMQRLAAALPAPR
ncbi:hypothetical protein, partial [Kitasatospora sp. NPDC088346]|uniref:hypothetical protein n=1 Tax=Kitasatospora sp. NPDC088346 TaxID=3364073 RepID=UPI00382B077D